MDRVKNQINFDVFFMPLLSDNLIDTSYCFLPLQLLV